ncbi:sensor histidine kinase [Paenibacillus sp. HJL G12]|uniref:Sensor histidine kinase n=1 Tax=Paenibacillus dendrobii TaxID=2691084 RepID=A0A7X3IRL0_9BACL|nr:histidine kinase [Paenibacillus dendrobii]MWV46952.1 sensor histidine kinase [Paenibacillus dendrobii]
MKLLFRLKDSSIFMKMMAVFLSVLLPLMMITWFINERGASSIQTEISRSTLNTASFYLDSLDKEVERISQYLPNYVTDSDLMELAAIGTDMTYYERAQSITLIQKRLDLMKNSSPFIREAKAYVPLIQRTLLSVKYETGLSEEEYAAMQHGGPYYNDPFIYWKDRLFLTMSYPANTFKSPLYVVGVELSTDKIREALRQITGSLSGESMLLNLERGWVIRSNDNSELQESLQAFIQKKQLADVKQGYDMVHFGSERYLTVFKYSEVWKTYLITCIPEKAVLGPIHTYRQWFWWACALAIVVGTFFSYSLIKLMYRPLMRLIHGFKRVQKLELIPVPIDRRRDEFGYLYQAFNDTVYSLKTLIEQNYEQQIRNQRSELKRLQSQINPHFLYNCFFVLCRLIKSDNKDKAYQFCLYIGEYFQFITRDDEDVIPLGLEVKHSRTYLDMQTICYGDRIRVRFDVEELPLQVPRLILQPIIENAYKHGFGGMAGPGELIVTGLMEEARYTICVEDNGNNLDDDKLEQLRAKLTHSADRMEETTGLINVHRRIELHYGAEYGLEVSRSSLGGLKVFIHLGVE